MALVWMGEHAELDRALIGGKAYSLNRMHTLGLSVPPAFVLTTDECVRHLASGGPLDDGLVAQVHEAVHELESRTGHMFGGHELPLLVSVRSGAAWSMPGMMDTVLNLGINAEVEAALRNKTGDAAYAADTHRRFREQFERVVGLTPPTDPWEQLPAAIKAVFASWSSSRAVAYRRHHGIPNDGGTSATVQAMVFGNLDEKSGTGVLFTRNPLTGDREPYGEWLPGGQGEDVVSGRHNPMPLTELARRMPAVHAELMKAASVLEATGRDVQDIEFTVEGGKLWLLQSRAAKRSPDAAIQFAVALHEGGLITLDEALHLVTPAQVAAVSRPHVSPQARKSAQVLAHGEPACPGVATGRIVLDVATAELLTDEGVDTVLARPTTDPDDVAGMIVATAILTEIGGSTSHAAVISRELSTPCIVGCGVGALTGLAGLEVTVDATIGEVYEGHLPMAPDVAHNPALATLLQWARDRVPDAEHKGTPATLLEAVHAAIDSAQASSSLSGAAPPPAE
jgi:pyruvate, orthophosphate dikinase